MSKHAAEPVAYAVFAENGNIRIWSADPIQVETLRQEYGDQVQALYAVPQPAERRCEYCDGTGDVHSIDGEWRGACDCQQSAPDVSALAEALERIARHPRTRGDELGYAGCRNIAKEALAAHRREPSHDNQ